MDHFVEANAALSKFSRDYMQLKRSLPIRPSEMGVVNILVHTPGPHTAGMLAERLGVSRPMITAHIASLLRQGYVTREPSPTDKRAAHILPTEKARMLAAQAQRETDAQLTHLSQVMGQEEFDTLVQLAARASSIMEVYEHGSER